MNTSGPAIFDELVLQPALPDQPIAADSPEDVQQEFRANLKGEIEEVLSGIENPALADIARNILGELLRFFDWLSRIDDNLHKLDTLQESLSLLEVLELEARLLVDFVETQAMPAESVDDVLREVMDGMVYSINHDLRRIFERELLRTATQQSTPVVYGKILHAHGLLSNCFQQTTITLLQYFKSTVDGAKLFDDAELRLKQSLVLCRDLSSLMRFVRRAETQTDPDMLRKVVVKILEFRDGSMQYLMYKDWRGYETLALEVVTSIENNLDSQSLLHQLACYLEILYGHVKMRAVLANIFPYSGDHDED
ncbi:MAG: hypothetical protein ABR555_07350 [Pyrinomonadaceae bacterium]